jgi:hypothetical protein
LSDPLTRVLTEGLRVSCVVCAAHLLPTESRPLEALPEDIASTLRQSTKFERLLLTSSHGGSSSSSVPLPLPSAQPRATAETKIDEVASEAESGAAPTTTEASSKSGAGAVAVNMEHMSHSAAMSQVAVLEEDTVHDPTLFPPGTAHSRSAHHPTHHRAESRRLVISSSHPLRSV